MFLLSVSDKMVTEAEVLNDMSKLLIEKIGIDRLRKEDWRLNTEQLENGNIILYAASQQKVFFAEYNAQTGLIGEPRMGTHHLNYDLWNKFESGSPRCVSLGGDKRDYDTQIEEDFQPEEFKLPQEEKLSLKRQIIKRSVK